MSKLSTVTSRLHSAGLKLCAMEKYWKLFFLIFFISLPKVYAQVGGQTSFDFLNLPTNAKQIALGGTNISAYASDPTMFTANPALLTDSTDQQLAMSHHWYYAGISHLSAFYTRTAGKGSWGVSLQTVNYGDFDGYDQTGLPTGTFRSRDFALVVAHSRQVNAFRLGVNMKLVQSTIEQYSASGLLFDMGGAFIHPEKDLVVGIALKNIGFSFQNYSESQSFVMPFDAQVGFTYKPERMPLRLSVTYHHLQKFDIAYDDPAISTRIDAFGNVIREDIGFADKLSRHFVIGGEFVLGKSLNLRAGYNFLRRKELQIEDRAGLAGFSFGFMLRIKRLEFAYSRSIYHITGGTSNLTIAVNTRSLFRKKTVIE